MRPNRFKEYLNISTIAAFLGTAWATITSLKHLFLVKLSIPCYLTWNMLQQIELEKWPRIVLHGTSDGFDGIPDTLDILVKFPQTFYVRLEIESTGEDTYKTTLTFLRSDLTRIKKYFNDLKEVYEDGNRTKCKSDEETN